MLDLLKIRIRNKGISDICDITRVTRERRVREIKSSLLSTCEPYRISYTHGKGISRVNTMIMSYVK